MSDAPDSPDPLERRSPWAFWMGDPIPFFPWRQLPLFVGVAFSLLLALGLWQFWSDWSRPGRLEPYGGFYFVNRVELPVPEFFQGDPRWADLALGPSEDTLGSAGCAVASTAMVLSFYGVDTDPQRLNRFLSEHEGYTPQGWIYWEKAAELAPEKVRHVYEDLASHRLIDTNLWRGNPVIVKLRLKSGTTHFVVIAGKTGFDYLTRDPGSGGHKGLYPLRELNSRIEGLRFYEKQS